ncbi:Acidic amino acid decarboxylase GADL1 [Pseudolycoriella hygida]|uniref:Acidic amino acid decarboxylase GADL1 n=1 Tax=Pseudolycoriella hygida TaxID=35572 RepID=A0A9Q0S6I0_9DIPT|nr:Acidic amino acid decarboxylase GADL1 [Pseudolycoriella hygida]
MPARGDLTMERLVEETNFCSSGSECTGLSEDEDIIINNHNIKKCRVPTPITSNDNESHQRFESLPTRSAHENFLRKCIDEILNSAVFNATERSNKVLEFKNPDVLANILDLKLKSASDSDEKLMELLKDTIKYSVKTGHPYFVNQLFSGVDPYALIGQWLTDALNPSVYTYEVSPVFTLMEEIVLEEMRKIVGYENGAGDGIFCPGGSIANGYAISCARYKFMPDSKSKGLCNLPRLVLFTSEDSHYSVQKLASFMGIGSDNVYKIKTDSRGKLQVDHLEMEIQRAKSEGALPFLVSATAGTTVLGAFDPLDSIADICKKYNLWMHVDAAWGGGALMSQKYRNLLKGIERSDSVTWNPHKLLAAPQQCSTFLTRHQGILSSCHSTNATYLFQKDKFYDTKYDTGDKHIQCGRRADVLKFWFMWRAKGTNGLEEHVNRVFENAEYFTKQIKSRCDFEMVLEDPECTNISFWYIPPSLQNVPRDDEFRLKIHRVAPKIKERMMKEGTMMMTYQPLGDKPNFFRLVLQNSALNKDDMLHIIDEIERLGCDL